MKNKSVLYMVSVLAFIVVSSCNESFLDTKPLTEFPEEDVWTDPALSEAYINDLYNRLPWSWTNTTNMVDEGRSFNVGAEHGVNNMLITPDNASWDDWGGRYASIRACNIFLENIDKLPATELKDRMVGEVTFLRAWYYHMLVSYFGGVPLITNAYSLNDDFTLARSSYADCIKFIADECDKAADLLPLVNTGNASGRATKGAALALKSRTLLYAASDLHNNATEYSGFSNPELLGYTDDNRADRWKAAQDAAKAVIDLGIYSLYRPDPASGEEASQNYEDFFTSRQSEEDIFVRFYTSSINRGVSAWSVNPVGYYGIETVGAITELVDDYEMADGTRFSRSNPEQALEPYKNRDPRLYATLLYEGAKWRPRSPDLVGFDPVGVLQVGTWEKWDNETNSIVNIYGLDGRNSMVYPGGYNNTGTVMIKFVDRSVVVTDNTTQQDLTWRYFRYGEILLNYAEASIELGEDEEARTYLNMIRKRAGMPEITESGDALKERYRNERRIEMVFEDQRFFDVRRWLIGQEAYQAVHGVEVVYELNPDKTTATVPTITPVQIMTGSWEDKAYFFPISREEINKNDLLIQNPGYN
ncbi:MAG: RagB/SusD family nutrient uptake outer membrane protein [Anditalea sp.]